MKTYSKIFVAISILSTSSSCSTNNDPFLSVQMCLVDDKGVSDFMHEMKSIALNFNMNYVDRGNETHKELESLNYSGVERARGTRIINISASKPDGLSFGATNLGLSQHQVVLGFSEGRDSEDARRFATGIVRELEQHWNVNRVPVGDGAKPLKNCD